MKKRGRSRASAHPFIRESDALCARLPHQFPAIVQRLQAQELRGIAQGNLPNRLVIDKPVKAGGWFSHWTSVRLTGENYKAIGEVTAWRVRLWEGQQLLSEQKSFLW